MARNDSFRAGRRFVVCLSSFVIFFYSFTTAGAATIEKANNSASLSSSSSWVGGDVPGSFDSAVWDSTLSGSNAVSTGGSLTLGQVVVLNPGGPVTINGGPLTLNGVGGVDIDMSAATQNLTLNCPVVLGGGQTWNIAAGTTLTASGGISGYFGLTIAGSGMTVIGGNINTNTYTGGTTVIGGTLKFASNVVEIGENHGGSLAIMPGAALDLSGIEMEAIDQPGVFSIAGSGVGGGGAIVNSRGTGMVQIPIALAGDATIGGSSPWSLENQIVGDGYSLTKTGSNVISFIQASSVIGVKNININAGEIDVVYPLTLGNTTTGSIIVNSGGTLGLDAGGSLSGISKPIVLAGGVLESGNTALSVGIALNATGTFFLQHNSILTLAGSISDGTSSNGLVVAGSGELLLEGKNTYSGNTLVGGGSLALGNALALQNSTLDTSGSGRFAFGSLTAGTLGGLAGTGTIVLANGSSNAVTLSVGNNSASTTYFGAIQGIGSLIKIGSGMLTLTGSSIYSGPTAINQGELIVNGSLASQVTVNSGGILGGVGSLTSVTVNAGGVLAPGDGPGTLTLSGSLSLLSGAVLDFGLDTPLTSDAISMPLGTLLLRGQQFSDFNFTPLANFAPGTYTLIDARAIDGSLGANTSGMIDGLPATLAVQGNNVELTVVPEPGTLALVAAVAIGWLGGTMRRRREYQVHST